LYIDELAPCQSRSIVGYMSLIASVAEVIALFFAEKVLKLLGTNLASVVILLAFAIRFAGYYYIQQPYLLILMETMHFFNFGILYVLIIQKANAIGTGLGLKTFLDVAFPSSTIGSFRYSSKSKLRRHVWFG
jgi:hypothetical protein